MGPVAVRREPSPSRTHDRMRLGGEAQPSSALRLQSQVERAISGACSVAGAQCSRVMPEHRPKIERPYPMTR